MAFLPSVPALFHSVVKNSRCIFLMRFPLSGIPQLLLYSPTSFTCIWGSYQWKDTISESGIIHIFSFSDTIVSIAAAFLSWARSPAYFLAGFFSKMLIFGLTSISTHLPGTPRNCSPTPCMHLSLPSLELLYTDIFMLLQYKAGKGSVLSVRLTQGGRGSHE